MKRISFLLAGLLMMGGMVMATRSAQRRSGYGPENTCQNASTERMAKEYSFERNSRG